MDYIYPFDKYWLARLLNRNLYMFNINMLVWETQHMGAEHAVPLPIVAEFTYQTVDSCPLVLHQSAVVHS